MKETIAIAVFSALLMGCSSTPSENKAQTPYDRHHSTLVDDHGNEVPAPDWGTK